MNKVEILIDQTEIARRVEELAREISQSIPTDFSIVGILTGSFVFVADLIRELDSLGQTPRIDFFRLSSYGNAQQSSREVRLIGELPEDIGGRRILLVDDIADTGRTLPHAKTLLFKAGATSIWTCALIDKPGGRQVEFKPDFIGFSVENVFLVGYGIDYAQEYRHLPYIGKVD